MKLFSKLFCVLLCFIMLFSSTSCSSNKFIEDEFGKNIKGGSFNPLKKYSTTINNSSDGGHYEISYNFSDEDIFYLTGNISGNDNVYDIPIYYYKYNDELLFEVKLNPLSAFEDSNSCNEFKFIVNKQEDCLIGYYDNSVKNKFNITVKPYKINDNSSIYKDTNSLLIYEDSIKLQELISPIKIKYFKGESKENNIKSDYNDLLNKNIKIRKIIRNTYEDVSYNACTLFNLAQIDDSSIYTENLFEIIEFDKSNSKIFYNFLGKYFKEIYNIKNFKKEEKVINEKEFILCKVKDVNYVPCFIIEDDNSIILFSWLSNDSEYISSNYNSSTLELITQKIKEVIR